MRRSLSALLRPKSLAVAGTSRSRSGGGGESFVTEGVEIAEVAP
jgi:hypothetical protein